MVFTLISLSLAVFPSRLWLVYIVVSLLGGDWDRNQTSVHLAIVSRFTIYYISIYFSSPPPLSLTKKQTKKKTNGRPTNVQ